MGWGTSPPNGSLQKGTASKVRGLCRLAGRASCTPGRVGKRGRGAAGPRPSGDGHDWREPSELEPGIDPCSPAGLSSLPAGPRAPPGAGVRPGTSVQEELPRPTQAGRDLHQPRRGKGPAVAGSWSLLNLLRVPRGGSVPVRIFPPQQQSKVTILTILMSAILPLDLIPSQRHAAVGPSPHK